MDAHACCFFLALRITTACLDLNNSKEIWIKIGLSLPSKNHLARNMQILQVFFLQDLQDLALNLANILQVLH